MQSSFRTPGPPGSIPGSIRPATEDDLKRVAEIEARVHPAPWSEAHFREELEKPYSVFWVLTDDETDSEVLGYLVFWALFDEAQILNVATDLAHRRQGHAQRLIRQAVQLALKRRLKKVTLDVRKGNLPAIQLYQALRFIVTHVRKGFYSDGEDAYQMTLALEGEALDDF